MLDLSAPLSSTAPPSMLIRGRTLLSGRPGRGNFTTTTTGADETIGANETTPH